MREVETSEVFCCDDELNEAILRLHRTARQQGGCDVQRHIDRYLGAVAYLHGKARGVEARDMEVEARFARMMVMSPTDSPQEGNLPDLGSVLRLMMSGAVVQCARHSAEASKKNATRAGKPVLKPGRHNAEACDAVVREDDFSVQALFQALPCLRRGQRRFNGRQTGHQAGLGMLLGLLLGLYPHCVKFPAFSLRVRIFREVHMLITGGGGAEFARRHPSVFVLAYMEYCAHVMPAYLPTELEVLKQETGMSHFFASCPLVCDTFRQEVLNDSAACMQPADGGDRSIPGCTVLEQGLDVGLDWARIEAHCALIVDKHTRACKSRVRAHRDEHHAKARADQLAVNLFRCLPLIRCYDAHLDDPAQRIVSSELAFLIDTPPSHSVSRGGDGDSVVERDLADTLSAVGLMQRLILIHPLPRNVCQMQLRGLHARMRVCERSALDSVMLYFCMSCMLTSGKQWILPHRGVCKLRVDGEGVEIFDRDWGSTSDRCAEEISSRYVCSVCQTSSVVRICTLGRVISIRQLRYYLAPCCMSIQLYHGTGSEFQTEFNDPLFFGKEIMDRAAWRPDVHQEGCIHRRGRQSERLQKPRCDACSGNYPHAMVGDASHDEAASRRAPERPIGAVAVETVSFVDHLTGEMRSAGLCQRHMPHASVLRHVANWAELMEEVRKLHRPVGGRVRSYK